MKDDKDLNAGASVPTGVFDLDPTAKPAEDQKAAAAPTKPERAAPEILEANPSQATTKARYAIMLDEAHDSTDMSDVGVGVNGRWYVYKRGEPVECPPEVLEVLDHAIYFRSVAIIDERTGLPNGLAEPKKIRRYPYQKFYQTIDAYGVRVRELPKAENDG